MKTLLTLLLGLCPLFAGAEQLVRHGPWQLHYIAMASTELTPEIAGTYGVTRSARRGVLILNLQHRDAPLRSLPASLEGSIRNLIGQDRLGEVRRVRESEAHYLIVEFRFSHLETMRFDLQIQPDGAADRIPLKFSQQFYTPGR